MKEEKGVLKKKGSALKIGLVYFLSTMAVITGAGAIYGNISLADYANNDQINAIAKELDCDLGYVSKVNKKYARMQHNGKDPVYVCFDSRLSELEKQCATKALDYMFGIVGEINSNYRYQIVNKSEYNKKLFQWCFLHKKQQENLEDWQSEIT